MLGKVSPVKPLFVRPRLSRARFRSVTSGRPKVSFWLSSGRLAARSTCSQCLVCLVWGLLSPRGRFVARGCFPRLLSGSSDLTCCGRRLEPTRDPRVQLGSLAARRPPLLPARTEATDSSSGRRWPPRRLSGPGPALSVLGGAGSGKMRARHTGGVRPAGACQGTRRESPWGGNVSQPAWGCRDGYREGVKGFFI